MTKKLREPSIRNIRKRLRYDIVEQYRIYYERNNVENAENLVKIQKNLLKTLNIDYLISWNNSILNTNAFEEGKRSSQ